MKEYEHFLKSVEAFNDQYRSICENGRMVSLSHNFWSWQEIQDGIKILEEWEIENTYIPFYGDWHDIYCVDSESRKVIFLNDERRIICEWENIENFVKCLSKEEIEFDSDGIVSGYLDF